MPTYEFGDMWSAWDDADLFLITTNATIKNNGALVMGRGIAKEARDRFPGLDFALGRAVLERGSHYYLLISPSWPAKKLGLFQVKCDFARPADMKLIQLSATALHKWCAVHPFAQVHLNYPGIGNGHLLIDQVAPLLAELPSNVHIWRKA